MIVTHNFSDGARRGGNKERGHPRRRRGHVVIRVITGYTPQPVNEHMASGLHTSRDEVSKHGHSRGHLSHSTGSFLPEIAPLAELPTYTLFL
jgi:hypothetical protein